MSRPMDPTLRGGIVALLKTGHANAEIADVLGCPQKTVAMVQHAEAAKMPQERIYPEERWAAGRRGHYDQDLNADIRMMLAEDRPTWIIAKECGVSEQLVRDIRQNDCPATIGKRRVEDQLMERRPFRIGRAGAALKLEAIAACFGDCLQEGDGAMRRLVAELDALVRDHALPDPVHDLLASSLQEYHQRRLSRIGLAARLEEIGTRLRYRTDGASQRERAS